jgi:hypothetical protein
LIVPAGTHSISETAVEGYRAAYQSVSGDNCDSLFVAPGGSATCTITNDDIPPALHLRKVVVNAGGGTATPADFTLMADGTGANDISGASPVDSGLGLQADTWILSETPSVPGYSASYWDCVGGSYSRSPAGVETIALTAGQSATCTITNTYAPPVLQPLEPANNCAALGRSYPASCTSTSYSPRPAPGQVWPR